MALGTFVRNGGGPYGGIHPPGWDEAYGGVPIAPNIVTSAGDATAGNLKNLPDILKLASGVNAANYGELMKQIMAGFPGYTDATAKAAGNIQGNLAGTINPDVKYNLGQAAAERGVARGGVLTDADYLRGLGVTSQERQDLGAKQYQEFLAGVPKAPLYDVSKSFLNPEDIYKSQLQQNVFAAAPNPRAKAEAETAALLSGMRQGQRQTAPGVWSRPTASSGIAQKYTSPPAADYSSGGIHSVIGVDQSPTGGGYPSWYSPNPTYYAADPHYYSPGATIDPGIPPGGDMADYYDFNPDYEDPWNYDQTSTVG